MDKDSYKRYVSILHKKEVRKNLLIGGSIFLVVLFIFGLIIYTITSNFEEKLITMNEQNHNRLDTLMLHRERQVNQLQAGITQDHKRRWEVISVEKIIEYTQRNMSKKNKLKQEPRNKYATWIVDESTRHGLDIALVASVIAQESRFRSYAISEVQAQGLMQVMDETGRWLSKELGVVYTDKLRFDPQTNIKMGTWYIKYLLTLPMYKGSITRALGHYNGGSNQSRAFELLPQYINHPEYKRSKDAVDSEFRALRDRRRNGEDLSSEEMARYKLLDKVRCAQSLSHETKHYIPEILERQKIFKEMMENPTSLILGVEVNNAIVDSTGNQ